MDGRPNREMSSGHYAPVMSNRLTFARVANSPALLLAAFVALMTIASVLYGIFEDAGILNSLYWAVVTATTLGYGDFAPHTTPGKVLTSALITSTVFLFIPTITANLASKLIVNRDAFTHEEQEEIKLTLQAILARLAAADDKTE
jgi:voltage-gated potassium channel